MVGMDRELVVKTKESLFNAPIPMQKLGMCTNDPSTVGGGVQVDSRYICLDIIASFLFSEILPQKINNNLTTTIIWRTTEEVCL